jgi:PadR family transcriptional regulator PadR
LILKTLSLGVQHGYGVLLRINQITQGGLLVEQGALYPALYRLETAGLISSECGVSDNNRKAKFYSLTSKGRKHLVAETCNWDRITTAMAAALRARAEEV